MTGCFLLALRSNLQPITSVLTGGGCWPPDCRTTRRPRQFVPANAVVYLGETHASYPAAPGPDRRRFAAAIGRRGTDRIAAVLGTSRPLATGHADRGLGRIAHHPAERRHHPGSARAERGVGEPAGRPAARCHLRRPDHRQPADRPRQAGRLERGDILRRFLPNSRPRPSGSMVGNLQHRQQYRGLRRQQAVRSLVGAGAAAGPAECADRAGRRQ